MRCAFGKNAGWNFCANFLCGSRLSSGERSGMLETVYLSLYVYKSKPTHGFNSVCCLFPLKLSSTCFYFLIWNFASCFSLLLHHPQPVPSPSLPTHGGREAVRVVGPACLVRVVLTGLSLLLKTVVNMNPSKRVWFAFLRNIKCPWKWFQRCLDVDLAVISTSQPSLYFTSSL